MRLESRNLTIMASCGHLQELEFLADIDHEEDNKIRIGIISTWPCDKCYLEKVELEYGI